MRLSERLERQGAALFRWRSFAPLILLPAFVLALREGRNLGGAEDGWPVACLLISLSGLLLRWATVGFVPPGTSGRNTSEQRADRLNITGIYSVVRNPLYLANFIVLLGVALLTASWWFVLLFVLAYGLYVERIIATEEAFLAQRFGRDYAAWAAVTPIFVPRPRRWQSPGRPFSLRAVLRREYNGVLAVASSFVVAEFVLAVAFGDVAPGRWLAHKWGWAALLGLSVFTFLTLRTLKRRTSILDPPHNAPTARAGDCGPPVVAARAQAPTVPRIPTPSGRRRS